MAFLAAERQHGNRGHRQRSMVTTYTVTNPKESMGISLLSGNVAREIVDMLHVSCRRIRIHEARGHEVITFRRR